jgi:hypothetical protein
MPPFRLLTPAAASFLLLGGCATLDWHKADTTPETRGQNLAACMAEARAEAQRWVPTLPPPGSGIVVDNQGRAVAVPPIRHDNERFLLEHDLIRDCMRKRGYVLQQRSPPNPTP